MTLTEKRMIEPKSGFELQDLREEKIHKASFQGAAFESVDMRDVSFLHTNLVNSKWEHIYFADIHLNWIQMGGTVFENIIRPQAEESQLQAEPGTEGWVNVEPVVFKQSDLSTAKFTACDLRNVEISHCNIEGLTIDGVDIKSLLEWYHSNKSKEQE